MSCASVNQFIDWDDYSGTGREHTLNPAVVEVLYEGVSVGANIASKASFAESRTF